MCLRQYRKRPTKRCSGLSSYLHTTKVRGPAFQQWPKTFERPSDPFAQALRYRMCFEDLRLLNSFTCLHDQNPGRLLPIVLVSTSRTQPAAVLLSSREPPNEMFHWETVAVRARVRHCAASLSSDGRHDSPQVLSTFDHDLLHKAHLLDLVL